MAWLSPPRTRPAWPLESLAFTLVLALFSPTTAATPFGQQALPQAQALEKRQDWPGLLALGHSWTQTEPGNPLAWFVLGRAHTALGQPAAAIAAYRRNLALDPADSYAANNLGNMHVGLKQHREALLAYRQAVQAQPGYLLAWRNLGQTYYHLKGPAGVAQALKQLQVEDPALAQAWGRLATTYALTPTPQGERQAEAILGSLSHRQRERMFAILLADIP